MDPARWRTWIDILVGPALAAAAIATAHDVGHLTIASSHEPGDTAEHGTTQVLDPLMGATYLPVCNDGSGVARRERVQVVGAWPTALASLVVCNSSRDGVDLNCGHCEKCVRTMLALQLDGRLADASTFPVHEVTPDMIRRHTLSGVIRERYWVDMPAECETAGRPDLARVIRRQLTRRAMWEARLRGRLSRSG
jgi:hypothetical protein